MLILRFPLEPEKFRSVSSLRPALFGLERLSSGSFLHETLSKSLSISAEAVEGRGVFVGSAGLVEDTPTTQSKVGDYNTE